LSVKVGVKLFYGETYLMKQLIKKIPVLGNFAGKIYWRIKEDKTKPKTFPGSQKYWENRYASGGNSGVGSYDKFAEFKAEVINAFVAKHDVKDVIEFGCGDGNQLKYMVYPKYLGLDVSDTAISLCRKQLAFDTTKTFKLMRKYNGEKSDLSLSLDVIYHLVEDKVFEHYMKALFNAARRYVIIYSSDSDDNVAFQAHIRQWKFTKWVQENVPTWKLKERIPNRYPYGGDYKKGSFSDFYIYEKNQEDTELNRSFVLPIAVVVLLTG
jgi:SAM-dependent methyltransferase